MPKNDSHLEARRKSFKWDVEHKYFDEHEINILNAYGEWMRALTRGAIEPTTDAQRRFVLCAQFKVSPETVYERVYRAYLAQHGIDHSSGEVVFTPQYAEFRGRVHTGYTGENPDEEYLD